VRFGTPLSLLHPVVLPRRSVRARSRCSGAERRFGRADVLVELPSTKMIPRETEPMSAWADLRLRRVGFRGGTHEELAALHSIEAPVEAERGSHRMPHALDAYIAFSRKLPSQFDDHSWLVEGSEGDPVACGFCWSNSAGDPRVMECDVLVRRDRRRRGIGARLFAAIRDETVKERRSLLTWSTFDTVPAGESFSRRLGAGVARVNRTSELLLADVDWTMIERCAQPERGRDLGYRLDMVDGVFPEHLRADAATFHQIMQTAPREDLDVGDTIIDADFVAELDQALLEAGRMRWTAFVRAPDGACVGGTEVTFEPSEPETVHQQNTGIDPAHRGIGLAKWAKATMLLRIRHELPEAVRVRTDNAFSNTPMLAINDALGFGVASTRTEWQLDVPDLVRTAG
jgi:mycothiol synthase